VRRPDKADSASGKSKFFNALLDKGGVMQLFTLVVAGKIPGIGRASE
jgi:hypothetical protein